MGPQESAINEARKIVAACPAFIEAVPEGEEPLLRMHWRNYGADPAGAEFGYTVEQLRDLRPCATFSHTEYREQGVATGSHPSSGVIEIAILQNIQPDDLIDDCLPSVEASIAFVRWIDQLLVEIKERYDVFVNPVMRVIVDPGPASREEMKESGEFFGAVLELQYGN